MHDTIKSILRIGEINDLKFHFCQQIGIKGSHLSLPSIITYFTLRGITLEYPAT